jgi:hypothetical protein
MLGFLRSSCARKSRPTSSRHRFAFEQLEDRRVLSGAPTVMAVHVGSSAWAPAFSSYLQAQGHGVYGYRIPVGSSAQSASIPWFNVDKISVTFSEDVHVQRSDLSLSGITTPNVQAAGFFYDAFAHVATWTFAAPLANDVYQIDLDGNGLDPVKDLAGNVLDGEWSNNSDTFPSGNGTAGGDFAFLFRVMPGDVNQNGGVEYYDYGTVNSQQGLTTASPGYLAFADVNGSGTINSTDTQLTLSKLWSTYPTGSPAGSSNDAPTTVGLGTVSLNNPSATVNVPLFSAIADAENADNLLTYSVVSNSSSSLFDHISINGSSGYIALSAASGKSGRATLTISATDQGGLATYTTLYADVAYTNQAPYLDLAIMTDGYDTWTFQGQVTDPDDVVEGMIVVFTGAYNGRATVQADGTFEFSIICDPSEWGTVVASTEDWHGLDSNLVSCYLGWT